MSNKRVDELEKQRDALEEAMAEIPYGMPQPGEDAEMVRQNNRDYNEVAEMWFEVKFVIALVKNVDLTRALICPGYETFFHDGYKTDRENYKDYLKEKYRVYL